MEPSNAIFKEEVLPCRRPRPSYSPVTQEGYPYIAIAALLALLAWGFLGFWAALPLVVLALYIVSFFRNPKRSIPQGPGLIVSPADGKVLEVMDCEETRYLKTKARRVSIFMSPFNCHINRSPVAAEVAGCFYKPGKFKAAYSPKSMDHNEHHAVLLKEKGGRRWLVVQIAGFLARRIVSYVQNGNRLERGEPFGLIQFGSRADLYCPVDCEIFVKPGEKVYAGKTVLGRVA
ncbi:MAG: phosphatidylserine decarboxylase family protein [Deltaproteobacteria bacterium]|nr:phosphatidylserine decarboxylase family protein [Deltaproteobacteria bacterium]MDZ4225018.1 phosphatidylserine decarboxylase family protein [bacterium]